MVILNDGIISLYNDIYLMNNAVRTFCPTPFRPPFYLKNTHLQTILPKFVPQPKPKYKRELHLDSTGQAAVAYDFIISHQDTTQPLAVMFHGLEGGSTSHYAKSFANRAKALGQNAVIVHYRGCGGLPNPAAVDYNAGDTAEMHYVLTRLVQLYPNLVAIGVSLGGNMLAKYLGEYGNQALVQSGVVVSAPVDLASSAKAMHKLVARHIYAPYLLKSLIKKATVKLDDPKALAALAKLKTLDGFDDLYTAPRHGYHTAAHYYKAASALPYMHAITKPTLVISSDDDPFLGDVAGAADVSKAVQLLYSPYGGHVGFLGVDKTGKLDLGWVARTAFDFFAWANKSPLS